MEAFSLLKYWRGGGIAIGGGGGGGGGGCGGDGNYNTRATTIVTAVSPNRAETDDENEDDDGPFFDLEFAVPDEEEEEGGDGKEEKRGNNGADSEEENDVAETSDEDEDDDGMDGEREFNFTLSSASSNDRSDQNLALSPSGDLFFKGRLVPIESSSLESSSKSSQLSVSFLKTATKFRVFMSGLKKKPNAATTNEKAEANVVPTIASATPKQEGGKDEENGKQSKFFTVKFKVEEVPIVSLFTRESSKSIKSSQQKQNSTEESTASAAGVASSDEKQKFSKDVMQKYLKKVKPLYIRVSKRYGEKLKFSGQLSLGSGLKTPAAPPLSTMTQKTTADKIEKEKEGLEASAVTVTNLKGIKQGNLPSGLRVVCKHLGKRRSSSSAVVAAAPLGPVLSNRRDDSLLQQQDGIQSAILHCKRSFNASRDSDSSVLSRSVSDPSHEKSMEILSSHQMMKGKVLLWTKKRQENEID